MSKLKEGFVSRERYCRSEEIGNFPGPNPPHSVAVESIYHSPQCGPKKRPGIIAQTYLLSEFLAEKAPGCRPPKLSRPALVHGDCHHKSLMKLEEEEKILQVLGLEFDVLDSGC